MMRFFLTSICLFVFFGLQAQTKYIGFKSHAGDMDFFVPDAQPEDDFGLPPGRMTKIKKINDSTVVEYIEEWGASAPITDTVVNQIYCSNPNIDLDSLKKLYPSDIIFEGFENKSKETPKATEQKPTEEKKEQPKEKAHKKKKPKKSDTASFVPASNDGNGSNNGNAPLFIVLAAIYAGTLMYVGFALLKRRTSIA